MCSNITPLGSSKPPLLLKKHSLSTFGVTEEVELRCPSDCLEIYMHTIKRGRTYERRCFSRRTMAHGRNQIWTQNKKGAYISSNIFFVNKYVK
jgi:hypothetical protein